MIAIQLVTTLVGAIALFWSAYVLIMPLAALARGRATGPDTPVAARAHTPRVAVLIPAYNMANYIRRCLASLHACGYPEELIDVYVVADHCTDDTGQLSREAGAKVFARDSGPRGKTYTIAWTLDHLEAQSLEYDLYVILDATTRVEREFLRALTRHWQRGERIVISHPIVDPENLQWFAQCLGLTLAHRNLQNRARYLLGVSGFIGGRGMAYDRDYIAQHGWSLALPTTEKGNSHPTEDWRHGVRVVEEGYKVAFADEARLFTPLRETFDAATEQGVRWEKGRLVNMVAHGLRVVAKGFREGSGRLILAGLDASQPPVAVLAGLSGVLALTALVIPSAFAASWLGLVPVALIAAYAVAVIGQGSRDGIKLRTVAWAPVYIAWRCLSFARAVVALRKGTQ